MEPGGVEGVDQKTVVDRALRLLDAFGNDDGVGVTELARRTGLPKSTTHRLLAMLEQRSMVTRSGSQYRLGLQLFELGSRVKVGPANGLRDVALPYIADLYAETQQTVHFGVLDGDEVVYVLKVHGAGSQDAPTRIGARMPAHCTAIGKALLAHSSRETILNALRRPLDGFTVHTLVRPAMFVGQLARIQEEGVAWDREETRYGLGCVAAPILDPQGRAVAAMSIAGRPGKVEVYTERLQETAAMIAIALFGDPETRLSA